MEAKDTVMSEAQIENWLLDRLGVGNRFEHFNRQFCKDFAQFLAEISFKAGEQKVARFVENLPTFGGGGGYRFKGLGKEWQDFLEEEGIDAKGW